MRYYLKAFLVLFGSFGVFALYGYFFDGDDWGPSAAIATVLFVVLEVLSELYKLNDTLSDSDED